MIMVREFFVANAIGAKAIEYKLMAN